MGYENYLVMSFLINLRGFIAYYNISFLFLQSFDIEGPNTGFFYNGNNDAATQAAAANFGNAVGHCAIGESILVLYNGY